MGTSTIELGTIDAPSGASHGVVSPSASPLPGRVVECPTGPTGAIPANPPEGLPLELPAAGDARRRPAPRERAEVRPGVRHLGVEGARDVRRGGARYARVRVV